MGLLKRAAFTQIHLAAAAVLFAGLAPGGMPAQTSEPPPAQAGRADEKKDARSPKGPVPVELRFTDNSTLKLSLRDEHVEMSTRYGKLIIPVGDIREIEFATRVPDDVARQIAAAIANLGSPKFKFLKAAKDGDREVARRADELLNRLRETVPEELLEVRPEDVVYTEDMKITGRIDLKSFRVTTAQFGEQELKLADVYSMHSLGAGGSESEARNALPDPGNLTGLQGQVGKTFLFRVTGGLHGSIWGTRTYSSDSTLAVAAVHAGILRPGQTGVVRVTIVPSPPAFQGSTQNGVTSAPYGPYQGAYRLGR
jgi:hypothetical protein